MKWNEQDFYSERQEVLKTWPTGKDVENLEEGFARQKQLPAEKNFSYCLRKGAEAGQVLLQPRAGVALIEDSIKLLNFLEEEADLLPITIDAYTRQNRYEEAAAGIEKSINAGHSLLNGFPAVNHGLSGCMRLIEHTNKPIEVRHGTPDARLLAEITLSAGFTSYEGGGISYNIPYTKRVPLEKSLRDWQYVDFLTGLYEREGIRINREPFGPLSGTLVPPFVSHSIAILEGLLALEQGVRSLTLGYGQAGNLVQDLAAIISLKELADEFFTEAGYSDYELTTVFHQWMGGFPEDESRAFSVISWGGAIAALGGASKVIVKTPHEAMGIPTREANLQGLKATRQIIQMLKDQTGMRPEGLDDEIAVIKDEVRQIMKAVLTLGDGDLIQGVVQAFRQGILDVPFAPSVHNAGKLLPIRDNKGAVRIFQKGRLPFDSKLEEFHRNSLTDRARQEQREPSFQMVIDDIYAISKGQLVGRPR